MNPNGTSTPRPERFNPHNSEQWESDKKGDASAWWTRDTYKGLKYRQMRAGLSTTNTYKIIISNLDYGITSTDIQEIFHGFGSLKTAAVHYDRYGRSLGTADVDFYSKMSALNVVPQYNNVSLNGRSMKIQFATTDLLTVADLATRLSRPAPVPVRDTRRGGGSWGNWGNTRGVLGTNSGNSSGRDGRGGRNTKKKIRTKDELDTQLDSIIKNQKYSYNM